MKAQRWRQSDGKICTIDQRLIPSKTGATLNSFEHWRIVKRSSYVLLYMHTFWPEPRAFTYRRLNFNISMKYEKSEKTTLWRWRMFTKIFHCCDFLRFIRFIIVVKLNWMPRAFCRRVGFFIHFFCWEGILVASARSGSHKSVIPANFWRRKKIKKVFHRFFFPWLAELKLTMSRKIN